LLDAEALSCSDGIRYSELSGGRAEEKTRQHRLTDVQRIEEPVQAGVIQMQPHLAADQRLIFTDQLDGGSGVPRADPADKVGEFLVVVRSGLPGHG
jgi:hypothetical protein